MAEKSKENKACFVIAPIGEPDSETRKRSDQVLKHIIRPAAEACGYEAVRADQIDKPGIITSQVIQRVVGDPLVIADLTETNPNVFYELAIRHAIRKPLVQIIKKGERIPFDIAGTRTINVDHHDLDSVEAAKQDIIKQILSLEKDQTDIETPISVSLDLQLLRQSENPEERSLADVLSTVTELRSTLSKIEGRLNSKTEIDIPDEIRNSIRELFPLLENELSNINPTSFRKRKKIDPYLARELARITSDFDGAPISLLLVLSFYREDFPWLYELGAEAYRSARNGDFKSVLEVAETIRRLTDKVLHGPYLDEFGINKKEVYFLMEELPLLLDKLIMFSKRSRRRLTPKNLSIEETTNI